MSAAKTLWAPSALVVITVSLHALPSPLTLSYHAIVSSKKEAESTSRSPSPSMSAAKTLEGAVGASGDHGLAPRAAVAVDIVVPRDRVVILRGGEHVEVAVAVDVGRVDVVGAIGSGGNVEAGGKRLRGGVGRGQEAHQRRREHERPREAEEGGRACSGVCRHGGASGRCEKENRDGGRRAGGRRLRAGPMQQRAQGLHGKQGWGGFARNALIVLFPVARARLIRLALTFTTLLKSSL